MPKGSKSRAVERTPPAGCRSRPKAVPAGSRDEARFRSIVETQDEVACCWLPDTTLTYCNARYRELFGLSADNGVGRRWLEFVPDAERDAVAAFYGDLTQQPRRVAYEHTATGADGTLRWIAWVDVPQFDAAGRLVEFHSVGRDITERKRTEQALQRANRAMRTRSDCSHVLMHATDENALLYEACGLLVDIGDYRLAWVGMAVDDAARSVRVVAAAGSGRDYVRSLRVSWGDNEFGRGPTGLAIREGRPTIVRDVALDPRLQRWRTAALEHGFRSSMSLPLKFDDAQCIGALNVHAAEVDALDEQEAALLAELAAVAVRRQAFVENHRQECARYRKLKKFRRGTAKACPCQNVDVRCVVRVFTCGRRHAHR